MTVEEKVDFVKTHCRKRGERLAVSKCSICHYPLGYFFSGDSLYFDSGCDCVYQMSLPHISKEAELDRFFAANPTYIPVLSGPDTPRSFIQMDEKKGEGNQASG